jgi:hypothetical protein
VFEWLILSVWKDGCPCVQINSVSTTATVLRPWKEVHWIKPPPFLCLVFMLPLAAYFAGIPLQLCSHFVYRNVGSDKPLKAFTKDNCLGLLCLSSGSCRGVKLQVVSTKLWVTPPPLTIGLEINKTNSLY